MFPETENTLTVPLDQGALTQALVRVCSPDEQSADEDQEMWLRYQAARRAGVFEKLIEFIKQHGALDGERIKWQVNSESNGVALKLTLWLARDCSLEVSRNSETVLADADGARLIFEPGARGAWIALCFEEHERLVRQAAQAQELKARQEQAQREAKRNRFD